MLSKDFYFPLFFIFWQFDLSLLEECVLRGIERTLQSTARRQNAEVLCELKQFKLIQKISQFLIGFNPQRILHNQLALTIFGRCGNIQSLTSVTLTSVIVCCQYGIIDVTYEFRSEENGQSSGQRKNGIEMVKSSLWIAT